jgi:hypothetical protein
MGYLLAPVFPDLSADIELVLADSVILRSRVDVEQFSERGVFRHQAQ